jgi:hypothetical protein
VQVEVARLEQSLRSLNKQLGEAEADYLTGTERLAALRREVSNTHGKLAVRTSQPALQFDLAALLCKVCCCCNSICWPLHMMETGAWYDPGPASVA